MNSHNIETQTSLQTSNSDLIVLLKWTVKMEELRDRDPYSTGANRTPNIT
jgi:hypothetical protein